MPNVNSSFLGQTLIVPGVYEADDVSGVPVNNSPVNQTLIFIGYGYGQQKNVAVTYSGVADLTNAIRGGPASDFVPFLINPSGQLAGANLVTFINTSTGTQSSYVLNEANGTTHLGTVTSVNYGVPSNLLQVGVSGGTFAGKKVTLYDGWANTSIVGDNLGVPFALAYTGTASSGLTYTVATSGLVATSFAVASPNPFESATYTIGNSQFETVEDIVEALNGSGFWAATTLGDGSMPATLLDTATAVALAPPSMSIPQYLNVTASLGAVVYWFNQTAVNAGFASFVVSGSVTSYVSGLVPGNSPLQPLSGATNSVPTSNDYAGALTAALAVPGWSVFVDTNTPAVQSLLAQHCITASSISNGMYRRGFTGSALGDSVATTVSNAQALNAKEVSYAYPGIWRVDANTNVNTLYSGLYSAACAAGISCGSPFATAFTNKSIIATGVESKLTTTSINTLQQGGVMPVGVNSRTGVVTFVQDLTTWQNDANPENVHAQQVQCRFALANILKDALGPYIGTIAAPITIALIKTAVILALNGAVWAQSNNGVIASWDTSSLLLNYTASNQTLTVNVSVALVGQIDFITVFVNIEPLNLTA